MSLPLARLRVEHRERLRVVEAPAQLGEDVLRVQQPRIDALRREVARADHEDLGRLRARRRGLVRSDAVEEAPEGPGQRVVVLAPIDLGHEAPAAPQTAREAALEREERNLVLDEGVFRVGRADVRRAVAQHAVDVAARAALVVVVAKPGERLLGLPSHHRVRLIQRDVAHDRPDVGDGPDRQQVDRDDGGAVAGRLGGDLRPAAGRRAEVQDHARPRRDEVELLVDVRQLKGRARPVALLLGEHVPLVVPVDLFLLLEAEAHRCTCARGGAASNWSGGPRALSLQARESWCSKSVVIDQFRPGKLLELKQWAKY
mmetsp:Transcript_29122/g.90068  ORF Transcript_29122/g.90068 Transcript_29122/m.90068 type:complete len:315 (+) Transcript_29122:1993-2937(+)